MGADGGLAWISVSDVKEFERLLAPWLGFIRGSGSDVGDDSRDEYWRDNPDFGEGGFSASYGTDLGDIQLDFLQIFMEYLERIIEDPVMGLDKESTFADILLERQTRPKGPEWESYSICIYGESIANEWLCSFVFEFHKDKSFWNIKIADWIKAIDALLPNGRYVQTTKTWT